MSFLFHFETIYISDNRLQARTHFKITSTSKTEKCLLKFSVKILIKSLKNPNESWTKEKITLSVEKMIKKLHNSNEKELLNNFLEKSTKDKKVESTLLKCGVQLYDMLLSITEKHSATEAKVTHGSVCIAFYFAKTEDLENYLSKLRAQDKQLFKDFSRIILNKTFLEIFDVNYQLVQWTMSEVKAYRGLWVFFLLSINCCGCEIKILTLLFIFQCPSIGCEIIKTEKFPIPLTGFAEDFDNTEKGIEYILT